MRRFYGFARRRRFLTAALSAMALATVFWVAGAFGDAGNPILNTIHADVTDNGSTVDITVRGEWNWLSHNGDCNIDRAGTGIGVIWNDPTEPGWTVTKNTISAQVGVKTLRAGDTTNQIDRQVHPVDIGNVPADGQGPLPGTPGQVAFDPVPDPVTGLGDASLWRSGCGREPVFSKVNVVSAVDNGANATITADQTLTGWVAGQKVTIAGVTPSGYNGTGLSIISVSGNQFTYARSAVLSPGSGGTATDTSITSGNAAGCLEYCGDPWGSYGYQTPGGYGKKGITHRYVKEYDPTPLSNPADDHTSGLPSQVCVNFYDEHGANNGAPTSSIQVDGNGDNSIQTNAFNVNQGANCVSVSAPTIVTTATDGTVGGNIHDTATLSGLPGDIANDYLVFKAYGPRDPGQNPNPDCSGSAAFTSANVPVTTNGDYGSGNFSTTAAGLYDWQVHYSGGGLVLPADSVCGDTSNGNDEISSVAKQTPGLSTDARVGGNSTVLLTSSGRDLTDSATLTKPAGGVNTITGTLTYHLYRGTCVAANEVSGSPKTRTVNGFGSYTSTPAIHVSTQGLYRWVVSFTGSDGNNNDVSGSCGDTNEDLKVINPSIKVTKTPHNQTVPSGGTASWTINVSNNSDDTAVNPGATLAAQRGGLTDADLTLTNVHVTDAQAANCARTAAQIATIAPHNSSTFAPGDSVSYTCSKTNVTAAFDNVVVACGTALTTDDTCDNSPASADDRTGHVGLESLSSEQNVIPNDTATLAGFTGTPNGNFTFKLYKGTCVAGNLIYDSGARAVNSSGVASTNNTTDLKALLTAASLSYTSPATYNWQISYTGDTNGNGDISPGTCGSENFTIDNDGSFAN
jgi:hypothetical protein